MQTAEATLLTNGQQLLIHQSSVFLYSFQKEKKKRKFFMKPQQLKLPQRGEEQNLNARFKKLGKGKSFQLKLTFKISKTMPGFTQELSRIKRNDSVLGFPYQKLNLDIQIVRREGVSTSLLMIDNSVSVSMSFKRLKKIAFLRCMSILPVCMNVPHGFQGTVQVRRGTSSQNWSYGWQQAPSE